MIVFNLLPFFGGQFDPLYHDQLAARLKAYTSNGILGPKQLPQDVELEELSQQFSEVLSPPKPAGKKQKMGDGSSRGQALEITESQE